MKKYLYTVVLIAILNGCSKEKEEYIDIPFTDYTKGYLLVPSFEIDSSGSFLLLYEPPAFYKVFQEDTLADSTINRINLYDFRYKMVITVLKPNIGNEYVVQIMKISRNGDIFRIDYSFNRVDKETAYDNKTYSILMIEKQRWSEFNFYENGEFIKQVTEPFH